MITKAEFNQAQSYLKKNGWESIVTVMQDSGDREPNYGILFTRNKERFWLNKDTINRLPEERR